MFLLQSLSTFCYLVKLFFKCFAGGVELCILFVSRLKFIFQGIVISLFELYLLLQLILLECEFVHFREELLVLCLYPKESTYKFYRVDYENI